MAKGLPVGPSEMKIAEALRGAFAGCHILERTTTTKCRVCSIPHLKLRISRNESRTIAAAFGRRDSCSDSFSEGLLAGVAIGR